MLGDQIVNYYAKRASEYEKIYKKPERQEDLRLLQSLVSGGFRDRKLLEIACGTGYWTQFACKSATSIMAIDCNEDILNIAREKDYGNCPVTFIRTDAYTLDGVTGPFSAALVAFWWSHIPKSRIENFFKTLHSKLNKGAVIIILDNNYIEGNSTPISHTDNDGNTYQVRKLDDGSTHEVLKNYPLPADIVKRTESISDNIEFTELTYFWLARYTLKEII